MHNIQKYLSNPDMLAVAASIVAHPFNGNNITSGATVDPADFIGTSAGSGSANKVPKLNAAGKLDGTFYGHAFGGDGSDGALSISSGTTTINLGSAQFVTKNYTSISITGTGVLAFSNPHANGTVIRLKSQGNVTITSSATRAIDARSMGASAGNFGTSTGTAPTSPSSYIGGRGVFASPVPSKNPTVFCGAGGPSGVNEGGQSCTVGTGGTGGGGLYIECGGALNVTGVIDVSAGAATNASGSTGGGGTNQHCSSLGGGASNTDGNNGTQDSGSCIGCTGGSGGGGGSIVILYNTLTANTGTYTVAGSSHGTSNGSAPAAADGASGYSAVLQNTEFA